MRKKGKTTRYPGVSKVAEGKYRVRFRTRDSKTDLWRETDRIVDADNPRDAASKRVELREQALLDDAPQERVRLEAFAHSWMSGKNPTLKASTRKLYASVLDDQVIPAFGKHYVDAITHADVVAWRDAQTGKPAAVNCRLRVLKTMFGDAKAELGLAINPAERVAAIRDKHDHDADPNCLTAVELGRVLDATQRVAPAWYPLFATLAMTGMRFGEATALKWSDIDERGGLIRINRSQWRGKVDTTKTGSVRTVPLPKQLAAVLKQHRHEQLARQAKGLSEGWVFPSREGTLLRAGAGVHKPLKKALKAAKVEQHFTLHGFRRTFNDLMRQVASGQVVRSVTGHVTQQMTEHYSHVRAAEKQVAVELALKSVPKRRVGTRVGTRPKRLTG